MRYPVWALAALLAVPVLSAQGRADFEFKRELAAGKRFHLGNIIGDVQVTGGSGRTVEVTAIKKAGRHGEPEDVTVETVELADGVALCVRYPQTGRRRTHSEPSDDGKPRSPCSTGDWNGNGEGNDTEVNFTVRVPAGLTLHIGTVSGDVTAERLEGDIELNSVSGDVRLAGGAGPSISLETVSGSVEILDGRAPEVYGHTISGEVTFRGPILAKGSYEFATTSGDISLSLPSEPDAKMTAATFSGRFSSDIPATTNASRRNRHRYEATWGNGSATLELESLSGDIRITTGSH